MLVLRSSPASPFGRKVKIAAHHLGLTDRIDIVAADTSDPTDVLRQQNPLGKIPALILEDGTVLYDSRVILEYLDHLAGSGKIIPNEAEKRYPTLAIQALADGIADAALLLVYEGRWRDEALQSATWKTHQQEKIQRGLAAAEALPLDGTVDVSSIALVCMLGYLDLRFAGKWRADHPRLVAFLDDFAARVPSFELTRVKI
ncbi:glutathione S-transferase N-terminal domain-containing protein [Kaistia terrae]|uniref:Glutathione S-transferase N-terminal domain-containing protein n=1 Tax=Kaistia terrae TaxID=537017 RepID=A0ABW0PTV2_9HYPH|nr:glutathione S-transferase N-terminal domain-containing protein [Kaistia terrae]MCX5577007.1 glutathione S-transferase N-terminal domain-containing protein [Kaistia terrae]